VFFKGFRERIERLERDLKQYSLDVTKLSTEVNRSSAAALRAELDDVRAAAELRAATTAKTLQRVLGHIGAEKAAHNASSAPSRDQLRSTYLPK